MKRRLLIQKNNRQIIRSVIYQQIHKMFIEDLADQPNLLAGERQPIEMYHKLIQQLKRLICYIIG